MRALAYFAPAILFLAAPAAAVDMVDSLNESCIFIQQRIKTEGELVIRFPSTMPPGLTLYDRYVENVGQCGSDEELEATNVPTRDGICHLKICQLDER
ncbi:hypothetical protein QO002_006204 [Pararhizobium capsulatum DSM 1112]|uniref:Uncharacterized protein n=1 Tax=Pararhizobium capsulatum DSM 1112 TaxID=1121113 RepID=A0ABU0C0E4_9HYPH|nr:hypothetical protein [Pararhizobium capsulatum]MDQ0323997.1 hypothetical protein [Pararhizobium capsulatum DSM 1112]